MPTEPVIKKSFDLPYNYTFTIQATPWTVRRTILKLLPWAIVAMMPSGRRNTIAAAAASRVSPLIKQHFR